MTNIDRNLLKASFLASCFTLLLAASVYYVFRGPTASGDSTTTWQARRYCLTKAKVTGDKPLSACPTGFHMANMAEIINPAVLKYDTTLGFNAPDSGSGPPTACKTKRHRDTGEIVVTTRRTTCACSVSTLRHTATFEALASQY